MFDFYFSCLRLLTSDGVICFVFLGDVCFVRYRVSFTISTLWRSVDVFVEAWYLLVLVCVGGDKLVIPFFLLLISLVTCIMQIVKRVYT